MIAGTASIVWGSAVQDVRIQSKKDEKRNTIYDLVNIGGETVMAKVEYTKECSGVSNRQTPQLREYWLRPKQSVELRKVWANSSCEYRFRIVEAEYFQESGNSGRQPAG
jgi:hypothetical protein